MKQGRGGSAPPAITVGVCAPPGASGLLEPHTPRAPLPRHPAVARTTNNPALSISHAARAYSAGLMPKSNNCPPPMPIAVLVPV
jgi:hypothetical protein